MVLDIYSEHIITHATSPHNYGGIKGVLGVVVDNPTCGDELTLYIQTKNGIVEAAGFTGVCCALSTASASLFTDYIRNKTITELKSITPGDIYTLFGVPVAPVRSNCVLLVYLALEKWLRAEDTKD
mgnify:CR=1 FL=1